MPIGRASPLELLSRSQRSDADGRTDLVTPVEKVHESHDRGALAMDLYRFGSWRPERSFKSLQETDLFDHAPQPVSRMIRTGQAALSGRQ
jgi:hypothetical protein